MYINGQNPKYEALPFKLIPCEFFEQQVILSKIKKNRFLEKSVLD